jgi:hypothetical protein
MINLEMNAGSVMDCSVGLSAPTLAPEVKNHAAVQFRCIESATKQRSIPFTGAMVRALLDGSKSQTRRIAKITPDQCEDIGLFYAEHPCPYGQPGDRLWVREAWRTVESANMIPPRDLNAAHRLWFEADAPHQPGLGKYRPGMFMPRWPSRITLEITGVRVERLQDISDQDCEAEGVLCETADPWFYHVPEPGNVYAHADDMPKGAYRNLWEAINGPGSWAANPWVWVVEFKRILESVEVKS